jgi:hypothetical protein
MSADVGTRYLRSSLRKSLAAASAGLLLVGSVTACTSGSAGSPSTGTNGTSPAQDPVAQAFSAPGVLVLNCNDTGIVLTSLDPKTGEQRVALERRVAGDSGVTAQVLACGGEGVNKRVRELVDGRVNRMLTSDGRKLVVQLSGFADQSSHVGYFDIGTGSVTDLTATSSPKSDFGTAPQDTDPYFYSDTKIRFVQNRDQTMEIDLGRPSERNRVPDEFGGTDTLGVYIPPAPLYWGGVAFGVDVGPRSLFVRGSAPVMPATFAPDPSGTWAAGDCGGSPPAVCVLRLDKGKWLAARVRTDPVQFRDISTSDLHGVCKDVSLHSPVGWVSTHSFVSSDGILADIDPQIQCRSLPPASDRSNDSFLVSLDQQSVLFESVQGSQQQLFSMPPQPGAHPQKIADLSSPLTGLVIAWK